MQRPRLREFESESSEMVNRLLIGNAAFQKLRGTEFPDHYGKMVIPFHETVSGLTFLSHLEVYRDWLVKKLDEEIRLSGGST